MPLDDAQRALIRRTAEIARRASELPDVGMAHVLAEIEARLELQIEAAAAKADAVAKMEGPQGDPGDDGLDADEEDIASRVIEAVTPLVPTAAEVAALVPKSRDGRDGKDAEPVDIIAIERRVLNAAMAQLPTAEDVALLVPTPKDGEDGKPGNDGSPDTPDEVVGKINRSKKRIALERLDLGEVWNAIAAGATSARPPTPNPGGSGLEKVTGAGFVRQGVTEISLSGSGVTLTRTANGVNVDISGGGTPGGSDTQVQFNDAGAFGGDAGFTYDKATGNVTVAGSGGFGGYDPVAGAGTGVSLHTFLGYAPEAQFFFEGNRKMVFGYNSGGGSVGQGYFYNDPLGMGVLFFDDQSTEGIAIGGNLGDYASNRARFNAAPELPSLSLSGAEFTVPPSAGFTAFSYTPGGWITADGTTNIFTVYAYNTSKAIVTVYDDVGASYSAEDPDDGEDYDLYLAWTPVDDAAGYILYDSYNDQYVDVGSPSSYTVTGSTQFTPGFPALTPNTGQYESLETGRTVILGGIRYAMPASLVSQGTLINTGGGKLVWGYPNFDYTSGFLIATKGGTGQTSVAHGDLLYGNGTNSWGRLAKDAGTTRYLSNQGTSNSPSWNQVNLANGVTGTLPVANGGTGATTLLGAGISASVGSANLTGQAAAKTATTLFTPSATGFYRISVYLQVTTPGTTSVLGGTTGAVITYNDGDGNVAQSDTVALATTAGGIAINAAGNTTATNLNGSVVIYARTGVAVQYAIGYTSTGTAMQYAAHIRAEAL